MEAPALAQSQESCSQGVRDMLACIEVEFDRVLAENQRLERENSALRSRAADRVAEAGAGARLASSDGGPRIVDNVPDPWAVDAGPPSKVSEIGPRLVGPTDRLDPVACPPDSMAVDDGDADEDFKAGIWTKSSANSLMSACRNEMSATSNLSGRYLSSQYSSQYKSNGSGSERHDDNLQLVPAWTEGARTMRRSSSRRSLSTVYTANILRANVMRAGEALRSDSMLQRFVSRPSSPMRIVWDLLSIMVMAYDLITIPLEFFDYGEVVAQQIMSLIITVFWSADIFASFFAGYHVGGLIELRPRRVAMHYLRTWFPVDVLVVSVDWTVMLLGSMSDMDGFGLIRLNKTLRVVRVLRVLRLLRLLRMLKVMSVIHELHDMIHSEELLTCINVVMFILGILLLNHYIACCWYGVGISQMSNDPRDSWVSRLQASSGKESHSHSYYYATALHWSLTQFTPASMEVVPCNTLERAFTIGVMLFAVILFSSLLSSITTSMINLRKLSAEKRKQIGYVRRYITDRHVTLDLGNRIFGFLRHHNYNISQRQTLHEDQIVAFRILPESLRSQLRCEVYLPTLNPHPFLRVLHKIDQGAMVALCTTSMAEQALATGQEKFASHARATHMYVPVSGSLLYYPNDDLSSEEEVATGTFICEAVLWVIWDHRGKLMASANSDLVAISAKTFQTVMRDSTSAVLCRLYAVMYQARLVEKDADDDFLTDICDDLHENKELVKAAYAQWMDTGEIQRIVSCGTDPDDILGDSSTDNGGRVAQTPILGSLARWLKRTRGEGREQRRYGVPVLGTAA